MDKHKTGTTTVALKCSDGIVLATDKRATMGYFISNKNTNKIFQLDKATAATIAGGVGDAQVVMRYVRAEAILYRMNRGSVMPVKSVATLLSNILNGNRYYPYLVMSIVAGIEKNGNLKNKQRIYSIDPVGGLVEEDFVATGSGSPVAYGLLESEYSMKNPVKTNIPIALRAVSVAMERDAGSGNGVNLATITEKHGFVQYKDSDVKKLLAPLKQTS